MTVLEAGGTEIFFCTLKLLCNRGCLLWFSSSLLGNMVWSQKYVFVEFGFGPIECKKFFFLLLYVIILFVMYCMVKPEKIFHNMDNKLN